MKIIEYKEEFGNICFEEGFEQKLLGKTIEEQKRFYRIKVKITEEEYSYGKLNRRRSWDETMTINGCDDVMGLIVKDGLLVGVELKSFYNGPQCCLPGESVVVYDVSDDDGVGSSDREDVAYLVCV